MISYSRIWDMLKEKGISTYALINKYKISANQIYRWKNAEDIRLSTLDNLCSILECEPEDILRYYPDNSAAFATNDPKPIFIKETTDINSSFDTKKPKKTTDKKGAISDNIGRLLKERTMTPRELSQRSGVPLPTIRNIQYGKTKNPHTDTIRAVAKVLGCSVDELTKEP